MKAESASKEWSSMMRAIEAWRDREMEKAISRVKAQFQNARDALRGAKEHVDGQVPSILRQCEADLETNLQLAIDDAKHRVELRFKDAKRVIEDLGCNPLNGGEVPERASEPEPDVEDSSEDEEQEDEEDVEEEEDGDDSESEDEEFDEEDSEEDAELEEEDDEDEDEDEIEAEEAPIVVPIRSNNRPPPALTSSTSHKKRQGRPPTLLLKESKKMAILSISERRSGISFGDICKCAELTESKYTRAMDRWLDELVSEGFLRTDGTRRSKRYVPGVRFDKDQMVASIEALKE